MVEDRTLSRRTAAWWILGLAALAALVGGAPGCAHRPPAAAASPHLAGASYGHPRTLRAEHKVTVEVTLADGTVDRRSLRGLIAVAWPDRLRLRAFGPAGITLFDLLYRDGKVEVIESLKDPRAGALAALLAAIGRDLALAYDLAPHAEGRRYRLEGDAVVVGEEGDRTVRLSDFRATTGGPAADRIHIENRGARYRVDIAASETTVDEPLDEALFQR